MPESVGGWKMIAAFGAVAGFMVTIMAYRTNEIDDRLRALEIRQTALECAMNPELCRAIVRGRHGPETGN